MSVGALAPQETRGASPPDPAPSPALSLMAFGVITLLFLAFFGGNFLKLVDRWSKDPSYSHGFLVPFLCLWLAFRAYRRGGQPIEGDIRFGSMAMLTGILLHLLLTVLNNPLLDFVATALVLWGLVVATGGIEWARHFLFPIGMLFFMFPLPATWTNFAALWLQDGVAQISSVLLDPFVVCYRRGNSLYLAGVREPLVVAAECSGLRQIVSFVAVGVLVGGLSNKAFAFRLLLVTAAIPLAILANVARIVLMATGAVWFGTRWMDTWMHDAPALVTLPLGLILYALVGWGLNGLISSRLTASSRREDGCHVTAASANLGSVRCGLLAGGVCLLLGLCAEGGLSWYVRAGEIPACPDLRAALAELPRELPTPALAWHGQDVPRLDALRARLPYQADDLLYRHYVPDVLGVPVSVYMAYSRQGEDRKHHPEICIRDASGATEDRAARRPIALDGDSERTVMRFRFRTSDTQYTTVYYWHYALEAAPARDQTFLRRLYQQQNQPVPSLTVQVSLVADVRDLETVEQGFLVALDAALRRDHLPATARMGCQRLPISLVRR